MAGMSITDGDSTWAMYYAAVYSLMACVSFLGCGMIICKADGCAKFYALLLLICFGLITIGDYWVIGALVSEANSQAAVTNDMRNYEGFMRATTWFLQLALYLNAAYDAW